MKMKTLLALPIMALLSLLATHAQANLLDTAQAEIINNKGEVIGTAKVVQGTEGVVLNISVSGLTPGRHGMHFHIVGSCEDHEAFKAASGHIAPSGKPHGFLNPEGPHEGNLPNLIVGTDGTANVELYSTMVSISNGPAALLDEDGSTLIIHTDPDDHTSQPIGGAGGRVACGVFKAASPEPEAAQEE